MYEICKEFRNLEVRAALLMERWLATDENKRGLSNLAIEAELQQVFSRRAQLDAECRSRTDKNIEEFIDGMRRLLEPVES